LSQPACDFSNLGNVSRCLITIASAKIPFNTLEVRSLERSLDPATHRAEGNLHAILD
jgi:hypothetical protein